MSFVGITFDGQNVSPKDDGALYATHHGDGVLDGCEMTIGGNNDTLVIQSGHIIAGGRVCKVDGATELLMPDIANTTAYIQVYLQYDVSQPEGEQWSWDYKQQAALPFGDLTQEDINGTGNIYQKQLAILTASNGSITGIYSRINVSYVILKSLTGAEVDLAMEGDYSNLNTKKADGTPIGGFVAYGTSGYTMVYHNGGDIIFRPNGNGSSAGEVQIKTNGQIVGGAKHYDAQQSGTITVSSPSSWYKICSIQNVQAGTYLAYGSYGFTGAGYSTQSFSYIGIGNNNGGWALFNPQVRMATATQYSLQNQIASPYYVGSTQSEVSLWGQCQNTNTVIKSGYMTLIRIA